MLRESTRVVLAIAVAITFSTSCNDSSSGGGSPAPPTQPPIPQPTGLTSVAFEVEVTASNRLVLFRSQSWVEQLDGRTIGGARCISGNLFGCNSVELDAVANSVAPGSHSFAAVLRSATFDLIPVGAGQKIGCQVRGSYTVRSEDTGAVVRSVQLPDRTVMLSIGESVSYTIDASL